MTSDYFIGLLRRIAAGHPPSPAQEKELTRDGYLQNGALTPKATTLITQERTQQ